MVTNKGKQITITDTTENNILKENSFLADTKNTDTAQNNILWKILSVWIKKINALTNCVVFCTRDNQKRYDCIFYVDIKLMTACIITCTANTT